MHTGQYIIQLRENSTMKKLNAARLCAVSVIRVEPVSLPLSTT